MNVSSFVKEYVRNWGKILPFLSAIFLGIMPWYPDFAMAAIGAMLGSSLMTQWMETGQKRS